MKTAQIHRFGDCVAMYLSKGETVYLTPAQAKAIAKVLNACAKDCKDYTFVNGSFKTTEFSLQDTGSNGTGYRIERKGVTS